MKTVDQKYVIIKDRVEIYKDFVLSLLNYIIYYYIDYRTLNNDTDINNHYNFCFNKVCDEFLQEGINFKNNEELREYFYTYYYHQFYKAQENPDLDISLGAFEKFWKMVFEIEKQKNKNIIKILIEIYGVFDKSINQEKNILELV